jgi:hypothetical protein
LPLTERAFVKLLDTRWQLATFSKESLRISPVIDTGATAMAEQ